MPPRSTKKPPASAARATRPGRGVAAERSPAKPTPAKQYRQIDGVRYDDKALGVADDAVKARGKIVLSDARKVFESVLDGPGITRVEYDTLAFVANGGADGAQYRVVASAKAFLLGKMVDDDATAEGGEDAATTVKKKKRKRVSLSEANSPTNSHAATTTTATKTKTKTKTKRKKTRETIVRRPETTPTPRATTDDSRRRKKNDAANDKKNDASGSTDGLKKRRRSSRGAADSRGDDGATVSDDTFSSDDAETVVKKRVVKRRRASAERMNYENELRSRAVRFAETETETADDDAEKKTGSGAEKKNAPEPGRGRESPLGSPLFSASPPPASPNTWLRRRSLSAEPGSPGHTAGTRETTAPIVAPGSPLAPLAPPPSAKIRADAREEARHTLQRDTLSRANTSFAGKQKAALFAVLERPVSARVAAAAAAGAFAAGAALRLAAPLFFGEEEKNAPDAFEWRALASRWADVESAAARLADALAAKRMRA